MSKAKILVGTAGWSVQRDLPHFPQEGSGLARYAAIFSAVEVNTSFYRRHRPDTWQRWHDSVPENFRFSVKLPRTITHERGLTAAEDLLAAFFDDVAPLGKKLGAVLIQLPPRLAFQAETSRNFLARFRTMGTVPAYIEPRHRTWASAEASILLDEFSIGRVHADPQDPSLLQAAQGSTYLRLHGSPEIYSSAYSDAALARYAALLSSRTGLAWCIFDNTASGAALRDALKMRKLLGDG